MDKSAKKILIADPDAQLVKQIRQTLSSKGVIVKSVADGSSCLKAVEEFQPDLIILELMLPKIHGIEILRKVKHGHRSKHTGVILMGSNVMTQNYHFATKLGCDFFLEKPFKQTQLTSLITRFWKHQLSPAAFSGKSSAHTQKTVYKPKSHCLNSYIKFWGTRGSNPVAGPDYLRFGGNTSCLEIRHGNDLLIVDAGTGIRPLGLEIGAPKKVDILLSHTHWDHLAGFPFFTPLYDPNCHITIWAPIGFEKSIQELFTEMLAYDFFPIRLDDIRAQLTFREIQEGIPFTVGNVTVDTHYAHHPGSTLMFKFKTGKAKFAYATDNEVLMGYHGHPKEITASHPLLHPHKSLIQFLKDCEFVIHEAQYTPEEYQQKVGWGHSSISNAAVIMKHAKIKHWIFTHHDPKHTDSFLLHKIRLQHDIMDDYKFACRLRMAFDGMVLPLHT